MPYLFWIMMGLLLFACLLTYIIPAGEFAVDENGKILGDQFSYLGHQNPVAPWRMFMLILQGLGDSGLVIRRDDGGGHGYRRHRRAAQLGHLQAKG